MSESRFMRLLDQDYFPASCFALYMAVRIAALLVRPLRQSSDFRWYYERGTDLALGAGYSQHGLPTAFWPVGWPGFLGALFSVTGPSALAGQIANLVFAAGVFGLTARLGSQWFADRRVGRAAVLLLALYPNQIGYVPLLSCEIFYQFLLILLVFLLSRSAPAWHAAAGAVLGLCILTKAQSVPIVVPVALCAALWHRGRRPFAAAAKPILITGAVALLVVSPWTYRNYLAFHAFIPVSTNGGLSLLAGNNPAAIGDGTPDDVLLGTEVGAGITTDPAAQVAMDRLARARAVGWIEQHPVAFAQLLPQKLMHLWGTDGEAEWAYQSGFPGYDRHAGAFRAMRYFNQAYYLCLILLSLAALAVLPHRMAGLSPWAMTGFVLAGYFTAVSLVFSGQPRYHFCLMPFMAMYAAWMLLRRRPARSPAAPPPIASPTPPAPA